MEEKEKVAEEQKKKERGRKWRRGNLLLQCIPVPDRTRVFLAGNLHPFQIQNQREFA